MKEVEDKKMEKRLIWKKMHERDMKNEENEKIREPNMQKSASAQKFLKCPQCLRNTFLSLCF
jgi:hypothetical protein